MSGQSAAPPAFNGITPVQQMVASCSGAIVTSLFVTPLDVVKIRLQAQKNPFPKGKCFVYCNGLMDHICVCENGNSKAWYKAPGHFSGTLDAFVKIIRHEGMAALWSGLPPTLVMAVPATVIYFTCYDQLCAALRVQMGDRAQEAPLLAGAIARVGSATVISPLELIRTKLQSQKQSYGELTQLIRSAVEAEGWRSLWRGLGPTLLRDVPFSAMYWYNYERTKSFLCERYNSREPTFTITFISGAVSGSVSSFSTRLPVCRETRWSQGKYHKSLFALLCLLSDCVHRNFTFRCRQDEETGGAWRAASKELVRSSVLLHLQCDEKDRGTRRLSGTLCWYLPQADQSGSGLRHHDQLVRVWKGLFPQTQPGEDTGAAADQ
uniref:Solute carrier family 25 member 40 n=1 Tax=Amphiprion percula TaxID=161767 RepID=A0A3P8RUN5_AMPPE